MSVFEEFGLRKEILNAIAELGFEQPTPIQEETIPYLLTPNGDMIGLAQTGTGKTAGFGLPILQQIDFGQKTIQALVLCPTRELCMQITKDMRKVFDLGTKEYSESGKGRPYIEKENLDHAADPVIAYMPKDKVQKLIKETAKAMEEAVKQLDFLEAARLRDELAALKKAVSEEDRR